MDFKNKEFYQLNKNTEDLVFPYATEKIIYRKIILPDGTVQILEIRKEYSSKQQKQRVLRQDEMSVEQFDYWKKEMTDYSHDYLNQDQRETRHCVSIENLQETDLLSTESIENEYIRDEEEKYRAEKSNIGKDVFSKLTPTQQKRYYKSKVEGKSTYTIAKEENVKNTSVFESIESAEKKISKELAKLKIIRK